MNEDLNIHRYSREVVVDAVARGIATREGFFQHSRGKIKPIPQRLRNPGSLDHWKDSAGRPLPVVNGYVNFPTVEDGWKALRAQCHRNIVKRALTFREFFAGKRNVYGGYVLRIGGKSDPLAYAADVLRFVRTWLNYGPEHNVTLDTQISALIA